MEKFIIAKNFVKKIRRFNLTGRTLEFKIKPVPEGEEPVSWIKDAIRQIVAKGTENLQSSDQVGFTFCSKDFARGDAWIRFQSAAETTMEDLWDIISNVYQSNSTGLSTETFCLGVTSVRMPAGKGKGRVGAGTYNTFEEECSKRRGIVTINNKDNICLARALVVAMAYRDKDPLYEKVRLDRGKLQLQRARQLIEEAAVSMPEEGCGISELKQFQRYIQHYKITVYQYGSKGRDVIFKGINEGPVLNLLYHKGHYNVITSLTAAFACGYYCEECHVPYDQKNKHRCGGTCPCCTRSPICDNGLNKICGDCNRKFRNPTCYDHHKTPDSMGKKSVCDTIKLCSDCLKTVKVKRQHTCGEMFCKICQKHQPKGHYCYIQPDIGKPTNKDLLFVFYDLETRQEKLLEDGSLLHVPNLCVFKQCCSECIGENKEICAKCGLKMQIVQAREVISPFMHHILTLRKKFKQVIVLAHNGQSFDHQFILNYILTETDLKPELIMRGTKIISMVVGNVKFLDSVNYFPMKLSVLPKAFGLGDTFNKGYFPYLFNTTENEDYVGSLPPIQYYDPDSMMEDERKNFLSWYEEHKNDEFNMKRDIVKYCVSDVNILAAACLNFRQQMMETTNVDPFTESCTIASATNKIYRRNFLKLNTISVIPKNGYRWRDHQSKIAIQWLVWEEKQRNVDIFHAAKDREVVLNGVKVDGYCAESNQVFEFLGCYWHGCISCFKHNRDASMHEDPSQTLNTRYESTIGKSERLKSLGYEVIEMWECEFRRRLQQDEEVRSYVVNHPLVTSTPLNPRDGFYGGRTGNTREYYKCQPGEKIKYIDVCSLYPFVCKYGKFPIGHPKVYVGKDCEQLDIQCIDGMIKCKVLPPVNLYHPVLPSKMNNKLMFVLCRTCGETMNQEECTHDDEQRVLTGTWVVDEVIKAIEKGYQLQEVYEIWRYDVQQYDKLTKVSGLFTEMMNKFIKVKQQASGWPSHCNTPEEKNKYIANFLEREDVQLEFSEITENPGLRSLAKLILNSFWGKFGQRENQPKTMIVNKPEEFFNMLTSAAIVVNSVLPVNDNTLIVNYEYRDEAYDALSTVNVVIASYVTTQARLKLYSYLEQLGQRVLYYDTDSVIYVSQEGEDTVSTGAFIGDMTDELECYGPGSYISEFVSGGPKNYSYKVFSTRDNEDKIICKVKGISLNYAASRFVNFEKIKDMVFNDLDPIPITSRQFRRTNEHEVITRSETKLYRPNSTKRKFSEDHNSVPYGYKKFKLG